MHSIKCFFCPKPGLTGEVIYLIFSVCAGLFIQNQNDQSDILTAILLLRVTSLAQIKTTIMLSIYLTTTEYDSKM